MWSWEILITLGPNNDLEPAKLRTLKDGIFLIEPQHIWDLILAPARATGLTVPNLRRKA
jgi:hypothetical protein